MKNIFIVLAFIGSSLLSLDASAQTYRGFTLTYPHVCASSNGTVETIYSAPNYFTYFNVDDFAGSTIRYQRATFSVSGYPIVDSRERISIRYANGSDFVRNMALYRVDGSNNVLLLPNIVFPPTGGWDIWANEEFYFADVGTPGQAVKLKLISLTDVGGPNVYSIKVEYATGSCTSPWGCRATFSTGGSASCY